METIDERIWAGVDVLVDGYVGVQADDTIVVAYTPESREPAAWITATLKARGLKPRLLGMLPIKDTKFNERFEALLPKPAELQGRLIIITVERDTMSHVKQFRQVLSQYDSSKWMAVRLINASPEFFIHAMNVGSKQLSQVNTSLLDRLMKIKTEGGTDLAIKLDSDRYRWISNRGMWRPGGFVILPAGEVATYPAMVDGVLVADGAFNVNAYTKVDARLGKNPLRIRVKESQAVDFDCADPEVRRLVELVFAQTNARHVGELGFGTNTGVGEFLSMNSHINERHPGVHLGFGQHNQSIYLVEYPCAIHMDMIAVGGKVWVDDDPVVLDLSCIVPSTKEHPQLSPMVLMDEDIDGDCCGIFLDRSLEGEGCAIPALRQPASAVDPPRA
jgi:hypothetical protein